MALARPQCFLAERSSVVLSADFSNIGAPRVSFRTRKSAFCGLTARNRRILIAPFVRPFFNTPAQGAWPTLMAATAASAHDGDYFGPTKRSETAGSAQLVEPAPQAHDEAAARRLWDISIEMTGVDPGI